jgi:hypothetical protein
MIEFEEYSRNDGKRVLEEKGLLESVREIPLVWCEYPSQSDYTDRSSALADLGGWETEVQIDLGPSDSPHVDRLTPMLDVYHPDHHVAVEHEKKEQMRARWHLMKMQAASERTEALDIDVAVMLYPTGQDASLDRTRRELEGPFFNRHFRIHLPVYVLEYSVVDA